ncbi:MAG: hypothetical protein KGL35_32155 [Bradyrhizobium sp.]|nr:hypothetical protein [Bradyrhizobium sp.]
MTETTITPKLLDQLLANYEKPEDPARRRTSRMWRMDSLSVGISILCG